MSNSELPNWDAARDYECIECGRRTLDEGLTTRLLHSVSCSVAASIEAISHEDRRWFEAHQFANEYRRPITEAEAIELRVLMRLPQHVPFSGRVVVGQLTPGARSRSYSEVCALLSEGVRNAEGR